MEKDLFGNTKENICQEYFNFWRNKGFPHYQKKDYNKEKEILKLINFNENLIFKNKTFKQTMHGCGFLWSYFPHWINVKYDNQKTISELWENDNKLKELIKKTLDYEIKHGNGTITTNRLRQNSKVYLSKQSVSNFRPTVAKFIYNNYGNNGTVWDMCCGWGGRLFGFLSSNCQKYIGTEPNTKTFVGLNELKNDFKNKKKNIELFNIGSEEYKPKKNTFDLCFTSPPYFDTEKYCDEETQSFLKYKTKKYWLNGFYKQTIKNCFIGLKNEGFLIVNIANTKNYNWIESETIKITKKIGFKLIEVLKLELSSISGNGRKFEPIFIFKKNS